MTGWKRALCGLTEIAQMAGVSKQRAGVIMDHPDAPEPLDELAQGRVWSCAAVEKFLSEPRRRVTREERQA
jgi:hypothetical protein